MHHERPLQMHRIVKWGECDPAGIIYTPRILDYALETLEAWNRDILGVRWVELNRDHLLAMPTVRTEIDFLAAPAPDDEVVTEIRVDRLGRSSLTFSVTGTDGNGRDMFRVKIVSCLVSRPEFEPTEIPEEFRRVIEAYQTTCMEPRPEA